jgi:tetratricopeptide (TPR) repeat protein
LRVLLRLDPARAGAWVDLGLIHARRGAMGEAVKAMKSALRADPHCVAAAANLAGFDVLVGNQNGAIAKLRAILRENPAFAPARLNLANALLLDRQAQPALDALDAPAPGGREGAHWLAHRALALILLGRPVEAQAALDSIAAPYSDAEILIVNRRLQLARLAGDEIIVNQLSAQLEALSGEDRFLYEHRIIALFDLARLANEAGATTRAFDFWTRGHGLLARLQPFSRDAHRAFIDASIEAFDADLLRSGARAANRDPAPVFIVGLPRSGTTLTEQILASHPQVHGAGERAALHDLIQAHAGSVLDAESARKMARLNSSQLDAMAQSFLHDLHAEAPDKRLIIDKMPGNAMHLGFISRLAPGAKIILCTRDLRDVGLSIFTLRFFGHHPYAHDLASLGFYLSEHERLMTHWRRVLPLPLLEVALTDWTDDFSGTLARTLDFLDLPHDPACERFYENTRLVRTASAAQVRQKVNRRGIGRWRTYETQLAALLRELPASERVTT